MALVLSKITSASKDLTPTSQSPFQAAGIALLSPGYFFPAGQVMGQLDCWLFPLIM